MKKMASFQLKGESWYCQFLYHGKRQTFTIGKVSEDEAKAKTNQADYFLMRLKQNLLHLPPGMDIVTFIEFNGKPPHQTAERNCLALAGLRDRSWKPTTMLLVHVKAKALQPWVYSLLCIAAYTGARRAELLWVLVADVDFQGQTVLIREKKRAKGKTTTRRIPLTPFFVDVLKEWLSAHPGEQYLFCQSPNVVLSKAKRVSSTPIKHDRSSQTERPAVDGC